MRTFLLFCCCWLLLSPARAQAPAAAPLLTLKELRAQLAGLPDTVQMKRLRQFVNEHVRADQVSEVDSALRLELAAARRTGNPRALSRSYQGLGYWAMRSANATTALEYYHQALDLARSSRDYLRQAQVLMRMGNAYAQSERFADAGHYLAEALAVVQQHQIEPEKAEIYKELAILASLRHQLPQALAYNQQALAAFCAAQNWPLYHLTLITTGILYKDLEQFEKSEQAFMEALRYAERVNDLYTKSYVHYNLPNTLLGLHKLAPAEHHARLGLEWAQKNHLPGPQQELYDILTRIREARGDYRQALAYHRLSAAYRDSVLNAEKNQQLTEAETRYQTKEKQARIARLDDDNARQQRQLWALAGGLALVLALLAVALGQYRIIRRTNARLQATTQAVLDNNQRIQEQASRLTVLMKELHHRVKNNLAIVSSLLRLQSNRLTDEGAVKAVREGQQRVEAMSLIHQRLYQTDNVTSVNMKSYITDLAEGLMTAYGYHPDAFDLRIEVGQTSLDVDLAVPLGLILNELLTNAFKYAYRDVARPLLHIRLLPQPDAPNGGLLLEVQDNGPGLTPSSPAETRASTSFGQRLIASLSEQVGGEMELRSDHGTCYRLHIPALALAA